MNALLHGFDEAPACYWVPAWLAWIALLAVTGLRLAADWAPNHPRVRKIPAALLQPLTFILVALGALLLWRWPMILGGPMMNPDETQLGAGAISYWRDPVPWRSVDLNTSGPLNAYFLWPAMLFDGAIGYVGLRLAALVAHAAAALACYATLRRFTTEGVARLAALPLLTFFAFCALWEFDQYSSEQLSTALLAIAAWLLTMALTPSAKEAAGRRRRLVLAGALLGALPFAKMQAVPLGLALGLFGLAAAWWTSPRPWRLRWHRTWPLAAGALVPAVVVAGVLTVYGLWAQFHAAYIEANANYLVGYDGASLDLLRNFPERFLATNDGLGPFLLGSFGVAVIAVFGVGLPRLRPGILLALTWGLAAMGLWTALFPGRPFAHYLHFLLVPMCWLGGGSLIAAVRAADTLRSARATFIARGLAIAGFVGCTLLPQAVSRATHPHPVVGSLVAARTASLHPVSRRLLELAHPGDTMLVWGWFPRLYAETGIPQGTREGNNSREIDPVVMLRFFRDRTLRDLRKNEPAFIVDAVCPGSFIYVDRRLAGLNVFPELAAYVAENYRLLENLDGYLIYVRKTDKPKQL